MNMHSVIFNFDPKNFEASVKGCETNPATPFILKYLPQSGLILEAGCGLGNYVKYLSNKGYNVIGVEINSELVKIINQQHPELDIREGDVNRLLFADNTFDAVLSLGVVEHIVEGPQVALRETFRVLKAGGVAIITVPCQNLIRKIKKATGIYYLEHGLRRFYYQLRKINVSWLYNDQLPSSDGKFLYNRWPAMGNFFEYRFTPKQFDSLVGEAGFEILMTAPYDFYGGLYQEFGGVLMRHLDRPSWWVRALHKFFLLFPYVHNHMYLTLVRKPLN